MIEPVRPHKIGKIPETLRVLLGAIDIRHQFIKQAHPDTREYWECQRDLANLERRFEEAEKVWAKHITKDSDRD